MHLWKARRSCFYHDCLFHSSAPLTEPRLLWWGLQNWPFKCFTGLLGYNMGTLMFVVICFFRWRLSCQHIFMRNTIYSSPSIMWPVTSMPRPALRRKRLLKLQVSAYTHQALCVCWNDVVLWQFVCVCVGVCYSGLCMAASSEGWTCFLSGFQYSSLMHFAWWISTH